MSNPACTSKTQPAVAVIILNWNGLDDTMECLQSLRANTYRNVRIWVLDNGSREDPSVALADFPEITLLRSSENLGFAGGNNYAAEIVLREKPDYLLLLNNDTLVPPEMISELVHAHQKAPQAGLIAASQRFYDNPEHPPKLGAKWHPLTCRNTNIYTGENELLELDLVYGCALLVPREIIERVGLFDDKFFAYWEDVDLSLRVQYAGYRNYCALKAVVIHKCAGSTSNTDLRLNCGRMYLMCRGYALLVRKHARAWGRIAAPLWLLRSFVIMWLRKMLQRNGSLAAAAVSGFKDGWHGRHPDLSWLTGNR